jgi:hypothetical protein
MSAFEFLHYCQRVTRIALERPTSANDAIANQAWQTYLKLFPPLTTQQMVSYNKVCSNRIIWNK